jgi:4'-phosphopantetheinyl transferase
LLLSRYTARAASDLRFTAGPFGRPELANDSDLRFNLAHTGELIAYIVTRGSLCGIDIEEIAKRHYDPHLAERILAPNEQIDIDRTPQHMRNEIFLEYWTLKEAYAKAKGQGLAMLLDTVVFDRRSTGIVRVGVSPEEHRAWRFSCWRPLPGNVLSAAVKIA